MPIYQMSADVNVPEVPPDPPPPDPIPLTELSNYESYAFAGPPSYPNPMDPNNYYDVLAGWYLRVQVIPGAFNTKTYALTQYRDNYVLSGTPIVAPGAWLNMSDGLRRHFEEVSETASFNAVEKLATNWPFARTSDYMNLPSGGDERDAAYVLKAWTDYRLLGGTIADAQYDFVVDLLLDYITDAVAETIECKCFYYGQLVRSLLAALDAGYVELSDIAAPIKAIADFMWDEGWLPGDGAFKYIINTDPTPYYDLNLLLCHIYWWLAWQNTDATDLTRGDTIFNTGVQNNFWGGFKQYNQQFISCPIGLQYRAAYFAG